MKQILTFILLAILTACLFLTFALFIGNSDLAINTLLGKYSSSYKISIIQGLYLSATAMTTGIALLTGINTSLLIKRLLMLRKMGKIHFAIGGSIGLGLISSGCAACGLPFLAFLGISGSFAFLPFKGEELAWITILLLIISGLILAKDIHRPPECNIKKKPLHK